MPTAKIRAGEIDGFHAELEKGVKAVLGARVKIRTNISWTSSNFRGDFPFELWSTHPVEFALSRGRKVSVVALPRSDDGQNHRPDLGTSPSLRAWVTWHEEWRKNPDDSFSLLTAAWTVFWGIQGDGNKMQVLRAEWDQKNDVPANPHWHVDPTLQVSPLPGEPPLILQALKPVSPSAGAAMAGEGLTIDRSHLGMGGWEHQSPNPSWRHPSLHNTEPLCLWAVRTLEHLSSQCKDWRSA